MKGYNKTILLGNLTRDPELRTTQSGQGVANFTLAVSRPYKDSQGEQQEQTSFINCVAWGKVGEIIAQYSSKGSPLLITGRIDQRTYEKDGERRTSFEVVVEDFNFIGSKQDKPIGQYDVLMKAKDVAPDDIDERPIDLSEIPF